MVNSTKSPGRGRISTSGTIVVAVVEHAGRSATEPWVSIIVPSSSGGETSYESRWPEWAYHFAEGALIRKLKLRVEYQPNTKPTGDNLLKVMYTTLPA